jgi:titin
MSGSSHRARPQGRNAFICGALIIGAGLVGAPAHAAGATVPGPPRITGATPGLHSVTVSFSKPATNGGATITGYRVTCVSAAGGVTGTHQSFHSPISVTGLTSSKTYTCAVAAINKIGSGPPSARSAKVTTLPTVPGAPTITAVTSGMHSVTVAFKKPASDGGAPIQSYVVRCGGEYGARTHRASNSPITIACVEGAEDYDCTAAATNRMGTGHTSVAKPGISLPLIPGAPTVSSVTPGSHKVTVAFAAPTNDGGVRVKSYRVTCTSSNGGASGAHQDFKSPISVAGLSAGFSYTCTVAAINLVSTGPDSVPSIPFVPLA